MGGVGELEDVVEQLRNLIGESLPRGVILMSGSACHSQLLGPVTHADQLLEHHVGGIEPGDRSIHGANQLFRFLHAYNAAARLLTAVDETLDTIINRLVIVGR